MDANKYSETENKKEPSKSKAEALINEVNEILKRHAEKDFRKPYVFGEFNLRPANDEFESNMIEIAKIINHDAEISNAVDKLNAFGQKHPEIIKCDYSELILNGILKYLEEQVESNDEH